MFEPSPNTRELLNTFRSALAAEEQTISEALSGDNLGIYLRSSISELDWYYYNLVRTPERTDQHQEHFYLLTLGVTRLIHLALAARDSFDVPTLTVRRNKKLSEATLEMILKLGFIEHGRRLAEASAQGQCTVSLKVGGYFFALPERIADEAFYERQIADHYRAEQQRVFRERVSSEEAKEHLRKIDELLTENVRVWRDHFIGYESDQVLDHYFLGLGELALAQSEGHDTFAGSVEFGGIPYQKYYLATAFFISLSLKHERFCEALATKHPDIRLEDILTITCERDGLIDSIQEVLNLIGPSHQGYKFTTREEAQKICDVLSITRQSKGLIDRPGASLPFAIEFSSTGFIRSLAGAQLSPAQFLLTSIRHHFPREYDRQQHRREASLQRVIREALSAAFEGLDFRTNIVIRRGGRSLTDIDLVAIDRERGVLFLVQLKSQDIRAGDIRAEGSKAGRLKKEAERWLTVTKEWLACESGDRVRSTLRLSKSFSIRQTYRLVFTRQAAHPLRTSVLDGDVAFATWLQLFNAVEYMKVTQGSIRTLAGLFTVLRKHIVEAPAQDHLLPEPTEYQLDNVKFSVGRVKG